MDNNSLTIEQVILDSQSGIFTTYDPDTRQVMVETTCTYCNEEYFRIRDGKGILNLNKCPSCSKSTKEPVFIEDWKALDKIPKESSTHILEVNVDMCNGYLTPKEGGRMIYLSTHSFYGTGHKNTTRILQKCGFNVTINNWDKK